jgi:hypothetical protein
MKKKFHNAKNFCRMHLYEVFTLTATNFMYNFTSRLWTEWWRVFKFMEVMKITFIQSRRVADCMKTTVVHVYTLMVYWTECDLCVILYWWLALWETHHNCNNNKWTSWPVTNTEPKTEGLKICSERQWGISCKDATKFYVWFSVHHKLIYIKNQRDTAWQYIYYQLQ